MEGHHGQTRGPQGGDKHPSRGNGNDSNGSDAKGKGKVTDTEPSIVNRLRDSGKMAYHAATASNSGTMPSPMPGHKAAAGSSRPPLMLSEASSSAPSQRAAARIGDSMKASTRTDDSSEVFDSFIGAEPNPESLLEIARPQDQAALAPQRSVAEQEACDGDAVVHLLSLPDDPADAMPLEDGDDGLSPPEAARLREALFGNGNASSRAIAWDQLLNFNPDFLTHPEASSSADAQLHTGTSDISASQSIWLQQWSDVLSAYTDEVWGDLGPLASEARREIDQMASEEPAVPGQDGSEGRALGRLRLILAHVRGYK